MVIDWLSLSIGIGIGIFIINLTNLMAATAKNLKAKKRMNEVRNKIQKVQDDLAIKRQAITNVLDKIEEK
jgi:uncharacterized membrane-anchored protein YhcB (DUF1043 family)